MNNDEIRKQNRDDLLERMSESGNAHSSDYPYGLMGEAEEEIKLLRKERDAARVEVCDLMNTDESGCVKYGSEETAISRGWDCFKEESK